MFDLRFSDTLAQYGGFGVSLSSVPKKIEYACSSTAIGAKIIYGRSIGIVSCPLTKFIYSWLLFVSVLFFPYTASKLKSIRWQVYSKIRYRSRILLLGSYAKIQPLTYCVFGISNSHTHGYTYWQIHNPLMDFPRNFIQIYRLKMKSICWISSVYLIAFLSYHAHMHSKCK